MMRKMTSTEICNLLEIIIGETEPIADTWADEKIEENLKILIDIGDWVLDGLLRSAEHRKDIYTSSHRIGERAYATILHYAKMALKLKQWIPCSARLPKKGQVVLWCNEHGSVFTSAITAENDVLWAIGKRHRASNIIAWMPLPEPYKED